MMPLKTDKQKDNLAKFLYDLAKIDFAALVVAQLTSSSDIKTWILVMGVSATIFPLIVALTLDGKELVK